MTPPSENRRILIVDDNASIHADYRKILGSSGESGALADAKAAFFGAAAPVSAPVAGSGFELESAYQGEEALEKVRAACAAQRPFAVAFVDVRMPPGSDGVLTTARLWEIDPELQVVLCTAFADYSWEEMQRKFGSSDRLLILKKPFDTMEVVQLASALTEKWNSSRREKQNLEEARRAEQEARAYAASLKTFNRALETAKASAEAASTSKSEFLGRLAAVLGQSGGALLSALDCAAGEELGAEARRARLDDAHARCEEICRAAQNLALQAGIELDTLEVVRAPCAMDTLLAGLARHWNERAAGRELCVEASWAGNAPATVACDQALLQLILDALLDNALRFTERGRIEIRGGVGADGDTQEPVLEIVVRDSGCGIPASELARIFEPLSHAREAEAGAHFSLHTARRLARRMGGELEVESEVGRGSSFRLRLALPTEEDGGPAAPLPSAPERRRTELEARAG